MRHRFYEKTNYPNIFKYVYWGNFDFDPEKDKDMNLIFENRNKFVEEHKIKKTCNKSKTNFIMLCNIEFADDINEIVNEFTPINKFKDYIFQNCKYYDHVEIFETENDKIIILSNPYKDKDEKYFEFIENHGFNNTSILYTKNAVSFYKVFNKNETTINYLSKKINKIQKNKIQKNKIQNEIFLKNVKLENEIENLNKIKAKIVKLENEIENLNKIIEDV